MRGSISPALVVVVVAAVVVMTACCIGTVSAGVSVADLVEEEA